MPEQFGFDLRRRPALGREAFFVSPANEAALARVDRPGDWGSGRLVLTGPAGAGKTHLAHVWAAQAGARVLPAEELAGADLPALARAPLALDDADRLAGDDRGEPALFHLYNLMAEARQPLLLTARAAPARWPVALPDLASRLEATDRAALSPPDDALLGAVLAKQLDERQLAHDPALIAYAVQRMERSFAAARRLAAALNREAFARRKGLTKPLIGAVLDKLASEPS